MTLGKISLLALGAALLAAPGLSTAQTYQGQRDGYQDQYGRQTYDRPGYDRPAYDRYDNRGYGGDYNRRRSTYGSYPQFRGIEAHIRSEILSGVRDDLLAADDGRDLLSQLRQIQYQEAREYRIHGLNLPSEDDQRIREQLNELDRTVDETRREP